MSNEQLVALIQVGAAEYMEQLWEQVRKLVLWKARRIVGALELKGNPCGCTLDDLAQTGYIALVVAVGSYKPEGGAFSTWLMLYLKKEFFAITGCRSKRERNEPLNNSFSLDVPLSEDEDDGATALDLVPDPAAEARIENVAERDAMERRHLAIEKAITSLSAAQQVAIRCRYYDNPAGEANKTDLDRAIRSMRHPNIARELRQYL